MKTTVEIPDDLYRRAKSEAAESGLSFRALLIDALRAQLYGERNTTALNHVFGTLAAEKEAVYELERTVDRDLEQVDANEWR